MLTNLKNHKAKIKIPTGVPFTCQKKLGSVGRDFFFRRAVGIHSNWRMKSGADWHSG